MGRRPLDYLRIFLYLDSLNKRNNTLDRNVMGQMLLFNLRMFL
jgi:hypothetical protein